MRLGILTALLILFHMQHVFHCSPSVVPGYLDFDNLPDTNFSCEGKVIGGYYADIETGCQMFHVCTIGQKGEVTDIKFLCLNGTVFDQETRVCERVDEVDCSKTEGFYDLNLELYGNNAALSFPEEEEEDENTESQENAESNDGQNSQQKTSTSKPLSTPPPSSTPLTPHPIHPASTTTPKTPIHPFVPTTTVPTYKPNQHITHFHSTTAPSIAAFLAINNAFSSSNSNQDNTSQYDDDDEEGEEVEDDDSITDPPGIGINNEANHRFPVTTVSSQIRPIGPQQHNVLQPNVKVQGTGESGFILNQANRPQQTFQSSKTPATSTQSSHLYHNYPTPASSKNPNAHSKHQLNTQLILNQQKENENKQHHGFRPITNPDNRNQFLFSSTTRQPPIYFTTKNPTGYSTTIRPQIEPFSLHAIGPQPSIQTTQQAPSNSPFPQQTNAHQVPANPLVQQIRSNIANNGGFLAQTIQLSQSPLTFQFNSNNNNNNRQGHQLFTTPSIAVIATTSSTSSSSSVKSSPTGKTGNISPIISLTSSIGSTPKVSVPNNSSVSVQLFSETTPPNSYDEYQEGDVSSDPFFRDVPKLSKPSTQLKSPVPTRHGVVRRKRRTLRDIHGFLPKSLHLRIKRKAQVGLPTEIFGTGEGRYRNRPEGQERSYVVESSRNAARNSRTRIDPQSRKITVAEPIKHIPVAPSSGRRLRPHVYDTTTPEATTLLPEIPQQIPQFAILDSALPSSAPQYSSDSAILKTPPRSDIQHDHRRKVIKVRRPLKQNDPEEPGLSSLGALSYQNSEQHLSFQTPTTTRPIKSFEILSENAQVPTHSETVQEISRNVPRGRVQNQEENQRHQQPTRSFSNLEQEAFTGQRAGTLRQRSRQRITSSHDVGLNDANRRIDHSSSGSELQDRSSSRSHGRTSNARGQGRYFSAPHAVAHSRTGSVKFTEPFEANTEIANGTTVKPPPPLPETNFTCTDKIAGGYYADLEADCQLFHICSLGRHGRLQDNKFFCGPGTRFNQRSRTCQARDLVDCTVSASLYYLNNNFRLPIEDDASKYNIGFEPKKVRSKRKAPKAIGNAESTYSIDNLPETSFTCADKPQDGLYADVETQCHVFHLCRTISGVITLDGSFVCPPGTIFNQPEGNCDTMKEVDCALYSAPEHAFRKTSAAHKNQGSKARAKRHDIDTGKEMKYESFKLKKNTNFKKLVALMNKKLRLRRSTSDEEDAIDNYGIRMKLHETGKNTRPIVTGFKLKKNTNFKKLITLSNKKHRLKRENDDIDNYNIRAKWHKTGNDKIFKLKKNIQFKKLATQLDKKHRLKRDTSGRKETIDYYDYVDDNYEAHVSKPINRPELLAVKKDQISQSNINVANTEEYVYDEDYDSAAISSVKEMREEPYTGSQQTENVGNEELPPERTIVPVDTMVITNEEHTSPPLPLTTVPGNEVNHTSSDVNTSSADTAVEYEYEYEYEDETTVASTTRSSAKEERNVEENNDRKIDVRLTTSNNGVSDFTRSTTLPSEGRISGHYITVTNTEDNTASKSKVSDDLNGKFKTIDNLNTETVPLDATPLAITTPSNGLKDVEDYSRSSNQIMETTQTPVLYSSITPHATFPTNLIENTNLEENQFTKRTMNQVETTTPVSIQTSSVPLEEVEYEYYYDDEDIEESNTTQKAPSKELLPPKIEFPVNEFKSTTIRSNEEHRSNNGKEPLQDNVKDKDFGENENLSHPENISGTQSTESTKADNEKIEYLEKSVVPVDTISDVSEERGKSEDKLVVQIKATPEPILKIPFREAHFPEQTTLPIHSFIPPSRENPKIKENKSDIVTSDPKLSPTDLFPELFETHTNPTFLQELDRNSAVTSRRNRINENIPINDDITIASLSTQLHKKSPISISEEEISTVASTTEETVITDTETMVPAPFKTITPHPTTLGLHESTTSKELKTYNPTIITTAEPLQETTPTLFTTTHITPHRPRNGRIKQSRRTSTRRPNLENDINTDTITVLTSTEPSRVTVPTTIPSLFRPSKQREVFRNRYATPDPPPVVIQARDNVSPRKPTRNRNRNTYTGNNFRNDEAKSRNAHRFSVQSSEIPETEKPLRVHSRRRTTTTSTTTTTVSPTVVVENPTVTDQVASSQNTVPSIHSSEPREFQESSTVPYVALSTYNETEDQTNVSFPPTRNSIVNLKSLNVKDDLSSETIDSSKLSTLVVSEGLDKTTLVKGIFSSTLNPLSTDDIVSINHAIGDNFPVETPTGKEYVFTQQNIGDEHTFSGNDIATPIPITTSTSNINETENTSLPSHLGYTLSSVNSQPSVAYNNNNDNYYNNSTGFVCTGKELHRYHPDPDDCRMFHYCSPGFHTRQVLDFRFTCENGTAFKADTQKCENETLVSNCRHQQS